MIKFAFLVGFYYLTWIGQELLDCGVSDGDVNDDSDRGSSCIVNAVRSSNHVG